MQDLVVSGLVMGLVATVALDLWALLLNRVAGLPVTNWAMVGRWVANLPRGLVFHKDIGAAEQVSGERPLGWAFHYGVGLVYGVALAVLMGPAWLAAPTLFPAWLFSILMLGFGWFLLQPGLGLGMAASRTPDPTRVRVLGLIAHTVFGVGLWVGALL
ncbi:DUF2938 domain-containing protein [uncultured Roseobacter sp.]|uniref:DUF2938 domain-containing protein n=1 Tax=uncultured Roseobacter sp. TaxID=114847 RepID=UPI0026202A87|nr:DUF2938 domain-containing protein [uncultured Roseobacter sp.]